MNKAYLLFLISFFNLLAQTTISIQPFDNFDTLLLSDILPVVSKEYYNAEIKILKSIKIPDYAYYKPRNRYRAEKILRYLDSINTNSDKIVGLTTFDISTTKDEYYDWGIFGYGSMNGEACVCSIFRLKKNATEELFKLRLKKLIIHELGHTFSLDHCVWPLCVMADYKGTIASLDKTSFHLCSQCKAKIR